jgi:hypothetical protein
MESSGQGVESSFSIVICWPSRRKRSRSGPRWPPGSTHRQPLSTVASSSANQKVVTLIGVESKKVASWCQRTSPPMPGCLKMYIDCHTCGCSSPRSRATAASFASRVKASNTGSRSCMAWPILLIDSALACFSWPLASKASSSKKQRTVLSEPRNQASLAFSWSRVVKTARDSSGSKASTMPSARKRRRAISSSDLKPGMTM